MSTLAFNSQSTDKIQAQAQQLVSERQFSSIEWSLVQHDQVLSSGLTAIDSGSLGSTVPIYRIYSMTKPIVSFVAMQLIDEGKLKLNDMVSQYIPAMAGVQVLRQDGSVEALKKPITIEHLLTHTAGFSYDFLPECPVAARYREVQLSGQASRSLAEVIGMLTTLPLVDQPGEQWRYSVATDVLAHVLENVSGQDLPELLRTRIFEPLNMQDTAFYVPDDKHDRLLPMFGSRELGQIMTESDEPNKLDVIDVEPSYPAEQQKHFYRGGHGLFSTLADYIKFMHVLQTGASSDGQQLLTESAFDLMWTNRIGSALQPLVLGFNVLGGYGWNLMGRTMLNPEQSEFHSAVGEGGWAGAASTYFWIDRANTISGIVMAQYIGSTTHLGAVMQNAAYRMFNAD